METSSNQLAARAVSSEDQKEETESDSADEDNDESDGAAVESNVHIQEEAVDVEDSGAKHTSVEPPRLIILSNRVKFSHVMVSTLLPNVKMVTFKHDQCDLDGILSTVATSVLSQKFESIAMIFNCSGATITLCGASERLLTKETIIEMTSVREFFYTLANNHIDRSWVNARMDILMCSAALSSDGEMISNEISQITKVPCSISKDLLGTNLVLKRIAEEKDERKKNTGTIGSLYFRVDKLRPTSSKQSISFFEKIRTVGKGAYGSAVLYRKKDDDSLVILKEINMHDLNASERQMALNEVKVLSMLEHPNIISYFDSFEEDGILMIEMDYADGGTLAQLLSNQESFLEERKILEMFQQMVSAIKHIHGHNILHRDLKTQNIFLTKEGVVKMGDFGISKMLTTGGKGANTVLGTPYYISPEMCEGKPYGAKSDIWALGCILYEMACLERTFEASNLPAVVNKIVKGVYTPVKGPYSLEFKKIVDRMLDSNPVNRPSADELWTEVLPSIMTKYAGDRDEDADDELCNSVDSSHNRKTMSALYYLTTQSLALSVVNIPNKIKVKEVVVGKEHAIIISQECVVFTYGRGTEGQLGHGDEKSRSTPTLVEALKGKQVNKACCGQGFSVFASNNGIVMTCGNASTSCLGHADDVSLTKPKLIEALLHVDVMAIACGANHVVVVGTRGEVYTWGDGTYGKLGLGKDDDCSLPMQVTFSESVNVKEVFCSDTSTMFLTDVGVVWACGSNKYNKLGLNQRQGFLAALKQVFNKTEVEGAKEPVIVRDLCRFIVTSISMGEHHTAVVIEGGKVITFGRNIEGQLGSGDSKPQQGLVHVKSLSDVVSLQVGCSPMSTIVSISNNSQIILLGSRYKTSPVTDTYNWLDPSVKRQYSTELNRSRQGSAGSADRSLTQISLSNSALREGVTPDGLGGSTSSSKKGDVEVDSETSTSGRQSATQRQLSGSSNRASSAVSTTKLPADDVEIHYQPVPVLNLQSEQSETVTLAGFTCHQENIFVLVETTAPPTQKKLKKRKSDQRNMTSYTNFKSSASSREAGDELSNSEMSEMDTLGATPSWIQRELADADYISAVSKKTPNDLEEFTYNVNSEKSVISKPPQPPLKTAKAKVKPSGTATVFKTGLRREDNYETGQLESTTDDDVVDDYELSNGHDRSALPTTKHEAWISSTNLPVAPVKSEGKPKNSKSKKAAAIEPSRNQRELNREAELQLEIEKLRKEAEASQMRISKLEENYNQKLDDIKHETVREAAQKERKLHEEVLLMKEELRRQNEEMQEQLLKIQKEKNEKENNQKKVSSSKICLIQ